MMNKISADLLHFVIGLVPTKSNIQISGALIRAKHTEQGWYIDLCKTTYQIQGIADTMHQ